jgi:hypothetical protein
VQVLVGRRQGQNGFALPPGVVRAITAGRGDRHRRTILVCRTGGGTATGRRGADALFRADRGRRRGVAAAVRRVERAVEYGRKHGVEHRQLLA